MLHNESIIKLTCFFSFGVQSSFFSAIIYVLSGFVFFKCFLHHILFLALIVHIINKWILHSIVYNGCSKYYFVSYCYCFYNSNSVGKEVILRFFNFWQMMHFSGSNGRLNRDGEVNGVAELFSAVNLLYQLIYLLSVKVYSFFSKYQVFFTTNRFYTETESNLRKDQREKCVATINVKWNQ